MTLLQNVLRFGFQFQVRSTTGEQLACALCFLTLRDEILEDPEGDWDKGHDEGHEADGEHLQIVVVESREPQLGQNAVEREKGVVRVCDLDKDFNPRI